MFGWYSTYSFFVQNFQNLLIHEDCHGLGLFIEKVLKKKEGEFVPLDYLGLPLKRMVRFLISPDFSENAEIVLLVESFPDFPELLIQELEFPISVEVFLENIF